MLGYEVDLAPEDVFQIALDAREIVKTDATAFGYLRGEIDIAIGAGISTREGAEDEKPFDTRLPEFAFVTAQRVQNRLQIHVAEFSTLKCRHHKA